MAPPISVMPITVSPPTRGWTAAAMEVVPCADGFPAHAGMDPVAADEAGPR